MALSRRVPAFAALRAKYEGPFAASGTALALSVVLAPFWATYVGPNPAVKVGRMLFALVAVTLAMDLLRRRRSWHQITRPTAPALLLSIGLVGLILWIFANATLWGCFCGGTLPGLVELFAWGFLVMAVATLAPRFSSLLLAAAVGGVMLGGALALAGLGNLHSLLADSSDVSRLSGVYGNPNYLAYAVAFAAPVIAVGIAAGSWTTRAVMVAAAVLVGVVIASSFSRGGAAAAVGGVLVALTLLIRTRLRRLAIGVAAALVLGAAGLWAYPLWEQERVRADFGPPRPAEPQGRDVSGWDTTAQGLVPRGASRLSNPGTPTVLGVTASAPGQGVSFPWGRAGRGRTFVLTAEAMSIRPLRLNYGLEDNFKGSTPRSSSARVSANWRRLALRWTPSADSPDARVYFWQEAGPSVFFLRNLEIRSAPLDRAQVRRGRAPAALRDAPSERPAPSVEISTELRGPVTSDPGATQQEAEASFVESRLVGVELAAKAFSERPLRGLGWETFPQYAARRSEFGRLPTHNEYLRFASELGLPGVAGLLAVAVAAGLGMRRQPRGPFKAAATGVLVVGAIGLVFVNALPIASASIPLIVALALVCSIRPEEAAA